MNRPLAILAFAVVSFVGLSAREQGQTREFTISGRDHRYSPAPHRSEQDDLVKITFTAADMPHSFNSEHYRIAKRAGAGQTVTFEFRADQAGSFEFYCNLKQDERCRDMKGTLVVKIDIRPAKPEATSQLPLVLRLSEGCDCRRTSLAAAIRSSTVGCVWNSKNAALDGRSSARFCAAIRRTAPMKAAGSDAVQREAVGPPLVGPRPPVQERRGQRA